MDSRNAVNITSDKSPTESGCPKTRSSAERRAGRGFAWIGAFSLLLCAACAPLSQKASLAPFATADGRPAVDCSLEATEMSTKRMVLRLVVTNHSETTVYVYGDGQLRRLPYWWLDSPDHLTIAWRQHSPTPRQRASWASSTQFFPQLLALVPGQSRSIEARVNYFVFEHTDAGPSLFPYEIQPTGEVEVVGEVGFFPFHPAPDGVGVLNAGIYLNEQVVCRTSPITWDIVDPPSIRAYEPHPMLKRQWEHRLNNAAR